MSTVIDRCRLRGSRSAIDRAQRQLQTGWLPSVADPEIVIVRRIATRSALAQMPRRLYREADRLLGSRVSGWSDNALDADCVSFDSAADLLARLSLDMALHRAADIWFWQSFRHYFDTDHGPLFVRLWQTHSTELPAACIELQRRGYWRTVWQRVSGETAGQLLPLIAPAARLAHLDEKHVSTSSSVPSLDDAVATLVSSLIIWQPPPSSADRMSARHYLALALALAAQRPHWLTSAHGERLQRVLRAYRLAYSASSTSVPIRPQQVEPQPSMASDRRPSVSANDSVVPSSPVASLVDAQSSAAANIDVGDKKQVGTDGVPDSTGGDDTVVSVVAASALADGEAESGPWDSPMRWRIEQGGLFYLLNLLNLSWTREHLFADEQAMAFPSGWGWLYRLGEAFGLQAEPSLLQCLATLSDMPPPQFPVQLPILAAAAPILDYGRERYAAFGIWQSALLQQTAQVVYLRPELDIRFRLSELDIRVRRAALDVDPGWIDWLGTRVRFHYQDVL